MPNVRPRIRFAQFSGAFAVLLLNLVGPTSPAFAEDSLSKSSRVDFFFEPVEKAKKIPEAAIIVPISEGVPPSHVDSLTVGCSAFARASDDKPRKGLRVEFSGGIFARNLAKDTLTEVVDLGSKVLKTGSEGFTKSWRTQVEASDLAGGFAKGSSTEARITANVKKGKKVAYYFANCSVANG